MENEAKVCVFKFLLSDNLQHILLNAVLLYDDALLYLLHLQLFIESYVFDCKTSSLPFS